MQLHVRRMASGAGGLARLAGIGMFGLLLLSPDARAGDKEDAKKLPNGLLEGRIVNGESLSAVEGATVVATAANGGPVVVSGTTDSNGWFHYQLPPGKYDLLAIFGDARWMHQGVEVKLGKVTQVPGALSVEAAEIITVHEQAPAPHHAAEAVRSTVKPILPYSDEAIDQDAWAVGWMLLDVNDKGTVTGFRFLHRPSYGLDKIAENEIWNLRFNPARDDAGKPMPSKVLWKLEWPSFHWAKDHQLLGLGADGALAPANREQARVEGTLDGQLTQGEKIKAVDNLHGPVDDPHAARVLVAGVHPGAFLLPDGEHRPPCKGSGPMNLDSDARVYRDCTAPKLGNVNTEPTIVRPANRE